MITRTRFFLLLILSLGISCLWHDSVHAMRPNSQEASPETTKFVRGILQELEVKSPETVLVLRFCGECNITDEIMLMGQLEDNALVPRYVWMNKEGDFSKLTEGQRRFLVGRVVMAAKSANSFAVVGAIIGLELLSIATGMLMVGAGLKLLRPNLGERKIRTGALTGGLVLGFALFIATGCYANAGHEQVLDVEAAAFSGDVEGVIELIKEADRRWQEKHPRSTVGGRLQRALGAIFGPLSPMPSTEKRLRYLRELAREQAGLA